MWSPCLYLCACYSLLVGVVRAGLTNEQRKRLLIDHNFYRSQIARVDGANIQILEWDRQLEAWAEHFTRLCIPDNSDPVDRAEFTGLRQTAENIWGTSEGTINNLSEPVAEWFGEIENYDNQTKSCKTGKTCDHFMQIIWATTSKLGCSFSTCYAELGILLACIYSPSGNWRVRSPYKQGGFCTKCAREFTAGCLEFLCSQHRNKEEIYDHLELQEPVEHPVNDALCLFPVLYIYVGLASLLTVLSWS